jgi:branched-chain amino acid transport system ATP-binding protein
MSEEILDIKEINTFYGLSHVLFDLSISIQEGELVCLLGRNGAGKTTTMRSIIGLTPPRSGSIRFRGQELIGKRAYEIVRCGLGYVPGDRRVYPNLTVRDNLDVGKRSRGGVDEWSLERVYNLFPRLKMLESNLGGYLSGGEQQMLTVARSLMGNPKLLLLDEPSEGLAPILVRTLEEQILKLKAEGITILLAEQNVKSALRISDRAYVIDKGKIFYSGPVGELLENEDVRKHLIV